MIGSGHDAWRPAISALIESRSATVFRQAVKIAVAVAEHEHRLVGLLHGMRQQAAAA
jgi:hypothetical protein